MANWKLIGYPFLQKARKHSNDEHSTIDACLHWQLTE